MTDFAQRSERLRTMRAEGKAPLSYEICIDEAQRLALRELIFNAPSSLFKDDAPLAYWIEMLDALPADEAETPGITHGFCL